MARAFIVISTGKNGQDGVQALDRLVWIISVVSVTWGLYLVVYYLALCD